MTKEQWQAQIYESIKATKYEQTILPDHDDLLLTLDNLGCMMVSRFDRFFCNTFISEMVQLLVNSIFLYEEGYFECGFYSLRQANEVGNSMLFIANSGKEELHKWNDKKHFPMNTKIVNQLHEIDDFYSQVCEQPVLKRFFDEQNSLIKKAHKIIHKQGFDTFYHYRRSEQCTKKSEETKLFTSCLKYSIAASIILYIITDPISLVLADEDLSARFNFDPLCEPADVDFLNTQFSPDIVTSIKQTKYFSDFSQFFLEKEKMLPEVMDVVRNQYFNLDKLDHIESQANLLNLNEHIILAILQHGIELSHIHPSCLVLGYFTSIRSNYCPTSLSSQEYHNYSDVTEQFNIPYHGIYRSVCYGIESNWLFEHNKILSDDAITYILDTLSAYREAYNQLNS